MTEGPSDPASAPVPKPATSVPPIPETSLQSNRLKNVLKWGVTMAAFAFLLLRQPLDALWEAARSVSLAAVLGATAVLCLAVLVGAVRWGQVMRAYGATNVPPLKLLFYYAAVGQFYNTYLPGAVGGDVVRGLAAKRAFGSAGTAKSIAVVFIDRVLGLAGLLTLVSCVCLVWPIDGVNISIFWLLLGVLAAVGAVISVSVGRSLGTLLPGPLGRLFEALPEFTRLGPLLISWGLSLITHLMVAVSGHMIMSSASDIPSWSDSLVLMPVAGAAAYFPLTVAGAGTRDTAIVMLYELLGMDSATALAGALAILVSYLLAAGLGGLMQLVWPVPSEVQEAASVPPRRSLRPGA